MCFLKSFFVPSPIDFLFYGTPKVSGQIAAVLSACQDSSGFSGQCWKRVSRAHSSGLRRSNDDVQGIAIQYRYLHSFRRARNTSASRTCSALSHPRRRIHDVVSHPRNIARLCPLSARFPSSSLCTRDNVMFR